jgi:hypothetical protein
VARRAGPAVAVATVAALAWPLTVAAAEPDDLADAPFAVGVDQLFTEAQNDGRQGERGSWELVEGRLGAGGLRLDLGIEAPLVELPVDPGPAVLFGGLNLFGDAGGDVGAGARVDALAAVTLTTCRTNPCRYETTITIPTDDLAPAVRELGEHARLMWVSAELTLVRTFAGGTWLQVLPFMHGGDGALEAVTGTLGAIEPTSGTLFRFGLFPADRATPVPAVPFARPAGFDYAAAVEARRVDGGDDSLPLEAAPARLRVVLDPPCEGSPALTVHDEAGDWVFVERLHQVPELDAPLALPVDVPWWITLHDGGGIDFDQGRLGWGTRIGPIGSDGEPILVEADFDCRVPKGVVRVDGAVVQPVESDAPGAAPTVAPATARPREARTPAASPSAAAAVPTSSGALGGTAAGIAVIIGLIVLVALRGVHRSTDARR